MKLQLEDRLYTSTEVADILGVSLRSVYRYLDDGKINAEVKTATGRLRFTRDNILDFLRPEVKEIPSETTPVVEKGTATVRPSETSTPSVVADVKEEDEVDDDVDWLARFRASAQKFRQGQENQNNESVSELSDTSVFEPEPEPAPVAQEIRKESPYFYYRSLTGGLKDIAQNIDKVARRSNVDYVFTLNAGLSLYKPLRNPFSLLHAYIRTADRDLFEKLLRLVPSEEDNAQLCLIVSDDDGIFGTKVELHGLFVVSKEQLKNDIDTAKNADLAQELEQLSVVESDHG